MTAKPKLGCGGIGFRLKRLALVEKGGIEGLQDRLLPRLEFGIGSPARSRQGDKKIFADSPRLARQNNHSIAEDQGFLDVVSNDQESGPICCPDLQQMILEFEPVEGVTTSGARFFPHPGQFVIMVV